MLLRSQRFDHAIDKLAGAAGIPHINQLRKPPGPNWRSGLRNEFRKRGQVRDRGCSESLRFGKAFVPRCDVVIWRKLCLFVVDRPDPVGERLLSRDLPAQTGVIQVAMGIDQPWQQRLFAKIERLFTGMSFRNLREFSNVSDEVTSHDHRAILNGWTIHRHNFSRPNDHSLVSPLTALRHSFTNRLQASWQRSGIVVAASLCEAPSSPTARRLQTHWSCAGSNFCDGNFVDGTFPPGSRFHKIVRKQPLSDLQRFPTTSSICSSEIFAATRYIPDCRFNVSRNGVVTRSFWLHALR